MLKRHISFFLNQGIPVRIDVKRAIAHNKVMVIDGKMVITGSFNFTKSAEENNAENLLVIRKKQKHKWKGRIFKNFQKIEELESEKKRERLLPHRKMLPEGSLRRR